MIIIMIIETKTHNTMIVTQIQTIMIIMMIIIIRIIILLTSICVYVCMYVCIYIYIYAHSIHRPVASYDIIADYGSIPIHTLFSSIPD